MSINHPTEPVIIKSNINLDDFSNTFLTSCFKYYYGKIKLVNSNLEQSKTLRITDSFLDTKKTGNLLIIDYANVIYTLENKYKTRETVIKMFYIFIYNQLKKKARIYIVSKKVNINHQSYSIDVVLNLGEKYTKRYLEPAYFEKEQLCIYNVDYHKNISSSTDDLLSWFICVNLFTYLLKSKKEPTKIDEKSNGLIKKLNLITNDKQLFDKNLFGLTDEERKNHINLEYDVSLKTISKNENGEYVLKVSPYEEALVRHFFHEYMVANVHDTEDLECNISTLLELLLINSREKKYGYFRQNKWPEYNPNFMTSKIFTKKRIPSLSYKNVNNIQKRSLLKHKPKTCKRIYKVRQKSNENLSKYYYLYVFIKYVQLYLNKTEYDNEEYADFFGSLSKKEILDIVKSQ